MAILEAVSPALIVWRVWLGGKVAVAGGVGELNGVAVGGTSNVGVAEAMSAGVTEAVSMACGSLFCQGFHNQRAATATAIRIGSSNSLVGR